MWVEYGEAPCYEAPWLERRAPRGERRGERCQERLCTVLLRAVADRAVMRTAVAESGGEQGAWRLWGSGAGDKDASGGSERGRGEAAG